MFPCSKWQSDRLAEGEINLPGLCPASVQHILAAWVVTAMIGMVALAATFL
jgi:hypothetical protein